MEHKAKILVVDDQMAVAMMMVFLLTQAGYETEAAANCQQALQRAHKETFDVIILDMGVPGVGGFELFQRLKQIPRLRETPILFVSDHATKESRQRAFDLGAGDFITKPFTASNFLSRISASLEPRRIHLDTGPKTVRNTAGIIQELQWTL